MIKVSVCYSNKSGQEFASCGLSDIEIDHSMLADPTALRDKIADSYQVCEQMVNAQLGTVATLPMVNPAVARANQPPPAPAPAALPSPSTPPPLSTPNPATKRYYDDRKQRTQDGPPTTGSQLGGVAKKLGALPWFVALGASQNPPLPKYVGDWSDEWAVWAWARYQATCVPPAAVPATNGNGHNPPY